jgi:N-hydroxyarylamine O-acetyltransferase
VDVRAYLDRIRYHGTTTSDLATLRAIHRAHLLSVPFENLDIHSGREIVLDESRLFHKVVGERRGGFCYELNGLFAALLRELGFQVTLLSAGVAHQAGGFGPEFDHLTLRIDLDGRRWLADVGFGECFLEPLAFDGTDEAGYHLVSDSDHWALLRGEKQQYRFTLTPRALADYAGMCRYHQTSPESSFTEGRLITQATPDGRITLTDTRLIVTRDGRREERPVCGAEEFAALRKQYFGDDAARGPHT